MDDRQHTEIREGKKLPEDFNLIEEKYRKILNQREEEILNKILEFDIKDEELSKKIKEHVWPIQKTPNQDPSAYNEIEIYDPKEAQNLRIKKYLQENDLEFSNTVNAAFNDALMQKIEIIDADLSNFYWNQIELQVLSKTEKDIWDDFCKIILKYIGGKIKHYSQYENKYNKLLCLTDQLNNLINWINEKIKETKNILRDLETSKVEILLSNFSSDEKIDEKAKEECLQFIDNLKGDMEGNRKVKHNFLIFFQNLYVQQIISLSQKNLIYYLVLRDPFSHDLKVLQNKWEVFLKLAQYLETRGCTFNHIRWIWVQVVDLITRHTISRMDALLKWFCLEFCYRKTEWDLSIKREFASNHNWRNWVLIIVRYLYRQENRSTMLVILEESKKNMSILKKWEFFNVFCHHILRIKELYPKHISKNLFNKIVVYCRLGKNLALLKLINQVYQEYNKKIGFLEEKLGGRKLLGALLNIPVEINDQEMLEKSMQKARKYNTGYKGAYPFFMAKNQATEKIGELYKKMVQLK